LGGWEVAKKLKFKIQYPKKLFFFKMAVVVAPEISPIIDHWRAYMSTSVFSDTVLIATLAFAFGVVAGAFHTVLSLLTGLLLSVLVRMFLASYGPVAVFASVAYYFVGFLWGVALYSCNSQNKPWHVEPYPWKRSKMYHLYCNRNTKDA
jgi:hypothetical protein